MCSKITPVGEGEEKQRTRTSKRIKKRSPENSKKKKPRDSSNSKTPSNLGPSRKIRTRTRKPKYLSLRLELSTSHHENRSEKDGRDKKTTKKKKKKPRKSDKTKSTYTTTEKEKEKEQLDLFPLHPEALSDKEAYGGYQYDAVTACLFNSATDSTMSSIHELLDSSAGEGRVDATATGIMSPYDQRDHGSSSSSLLVRTAMRRGASEEADTAEERWVSYSQVVEEVMSRSGTPRWCGGGGGVEKPSLALKLDYDHIMEAWSDKGPLYVDGEPPQTVPDLHAHEGWEGGSVWAVPEMEEMKRGRREASLLRYKEKRQSRLFSKRIRYEVRKLNAQKRPRFKGRFVKRADT